MLNPETVVFGVKCFNCDATKLYLRNVPASNNDDIEVIERGKVNIKVSIHKCQNTKFVCIIKIKNFQF